MSFSFTSDPTQTCPVCGGSHNRSMMWEKRNGKEVTVNAGRGHLIRCWVLMCSKCHAMSKNISIGVIFEDLTSFVRYIETKLPYQINLLGGTAGSWDKPTIGTKIPAFRVGNSHTPVNRIEARPNKMLKITEISEDIGSGIYKGKVSEVGMGIETGVCGHADE